MIERRVLNGLTVAAAIGLADQLSKWLVLSQMGDVQRTVPVTSFFNLVLVWNRGVTFGLLNTQTAKAYMPYILIGVAAVIVLLLGRWLLRTGSTFVACAVGLVMGGALGNIIDRFRYGAVVDFLDFHYAGYHWYAFNIADAAIVTGVALLLLDGMVRGK